MLLFGGLHIELTLYKMPGSLARGKWLGRSHSGTKLASAGVAESFLKSSHISRTRHAHQVTACTLYILMNNAYQDHVSHNPGEDQPVSFETWCAQRKKRVPNCCIG